MNRTLSTVSASTCRYGDNDLMRAGETFARHTTLRVGGPIAQWAQPQNEDELQTVLQTVSREKMPLQVLGAGSNIVAPDSGFDGVVLHLGSGFDWARVEENHLICGGAMLLPKATKFALANNLGNFEWACGVPGSVGGSVWGNAGARGFDGEGFQSRDCAADFHSLIGFERNGKRVELHRSDVQFAYRKSSLNELIVTQVTFALKPLTVPQAERHREAVRELLQIRRNSQPVSAASAGCIWKNPDKQACESAGCKGTGDLLQQLRLKEHQIGGAQVSPVHGNFLVNVGGATGNDVRELATWVEAQVLERSGIVLEREARFWE